MGTIVYLPFYYKYIDSITLVALSNMMSAQPRGIEKTQKNSTETIILIRNIPYAIIQYHARKVVLKFIDKTHTYQHQRPEYGWEVIYY